MTPILSVVVPHYQQHEFVLDCIRSIQAQTFEDFEIVLVDDDSTPPLVGQQIPWPKGRPMRIVWLADNRGTPGAINAGVRLANGRYIAIVHGDDLLEPWHLEQLMAQRGPHFCYGDLRLYVNGERGGVIRCAGWDFERAKGKNLAHGAILFLRQAWRDVDGYPEGMRDGREDWAFTLKLAHGGYPGLHVEGEPGYLYRQHEGSRSLRNHTPEWTARFAAQIREVLPEVYG